MHETESLKLPAINKARQLPGGLTAAEPNEDFQPGLIIVRYGDDKKMILNSFCQTMHLLNRMRKLSGCNTLDHIDLMSWSAGEIQNIARLRFDYAHRFLRPRETYLLVKVVHTADRSRSQRLPQYLSLLHNLDQLNPDLAGKLEQMSKPGKSIRLKNKWSNLGKKGADFMLTERHENKYSQNNNTSNNNKVRSPKDGRQSVQGVIATVKEREDKSKLYGNGSMELAKRLQPESGNSTRRGTKLPPIGGH